MYAYYFKNARHIKNTKKKVTNHPKSWKQNVNIS